jgi:hypothetical protein
MTGTATVTITPLPAAGVITGASTVATGATITLADTASGGTWSSSNTHVTVGSATGVVTGVSAGSVTISYTVTNSCGTASATHAVTETGPASRDAYAPGTIEICTGTSEGLTDSLAGGLWSSSNKNIATVDAQSGMVTGVSAGVAKISHTASDATGSTTTVITPVRIAPLPDSVVISVQPGMAIVAGRQLTLTAAVHNGSPVVGYQWLVNNVAVPGANSATWGSSSFANNDVVSCMVTGLCGNVSTTKSVTVTIANDGIVPVAAAGDIRVVPNPNNGIFTIKGYSGTTADQEVSLEITDVLGQVVYNSRITAHNGEINEAVQLGKSVANGMYLLNVNTGTEHRVFHIVVEQ